MIHIGSKLLTSNRDERRNAKAISEALTTSGTPNFRKPVSIATETKSRADLAEGIKSAFGKATRKMVDVAFEASSDSARYGHELRSAADEAIEKGREAASKSKLSSHAAQSELAKDIKASAETKEETKKYASRSKASSKSTQLRLAKESKAAVYEAYSKAKEAASNSKASSKAYQSDSAKEIRAVADETKEKANDIASNYKSSSKLAQSNLVKEIQAAIYQAKELRDDIASRSSSDVESILNAQPIGFGNKWADWWGTTRLPEKPIMQAQKASDAEKPNQKPSDVKRPAQKPKQGLNWANFWSVERMTEHPARPATELSTSSKQSAKNTPVPNNEHYWYSIGKKIVPKSGKSKSETPVRELLDSSESSKESETSYADYPGKAPRTSRGTIGRPAQRTPEISKADKVSSASKAASKPAKPGRKDFMDSTKIDTATTTKATGSHPGWFDFATKISQPNQNTALAGKFPAKPSSESTSQKDSWWKWQISRKPGKLQITATIPSRVTTISLAETTSTMKSWINFFQEETSTATSAISQVTRRASPGPTSETHSSMAVADTKIPSPLDTDDPTGLWKFFFGGAKRTQAYELSPATSTDNSWPPQEAHPDAKFIHNTVAPTSRENINFNAIWQRAKQDVISEPKLISIVEKWGFNKGKAVTILARPDDSGKPMASKPMVNGYASINKSPTSRTVNLFETSSGPTTSKGETSAAKLAREKAESFGIPTTRRKIVEREATDTALYMMWALYLVYDKLMAEGNKHNVDVLSVQDAWDGLLHSEKVINSSHKIRTLAKSTEDREMLASFSGLVARYESLTCNFSRLVIGSPTSSEDVLGSQDFIEKVQYDYRDFLVDAGERPYYRMGIELPSEGFHFEILKRGEKSLDEATAYFEALRRNERTA